MDEDKRCHQIKDLLFHHCRQNENYWLPHFALFFAFHVVGYELLIKLLEYEYIFKSHFYKWKSVGHDLRSTGW